jgi:hypothetical protein
MKPTLGGGRLPLGGLTHPWGGRLLVTSCECVCFRLEELGFNTRKGTQILCANAPFIACFRSRHLHNYVFFERLPLGGYDDLPLGGKDSPWESMMISPVGGKTPLGGVPMMVSPVGGKTPLRGVW